MEQIPVGGSSMLLAAAYDADNQELQVTFKNGQTWIYGNNLQPFTPEDAALFAGAGSKGQWFLENIRDEFPARRG